MHMSRKRLFILIWLACIIGSWTIIPYTLFAHIAPLTVSTGKLFLLGTVQASVLYGVILWLAYRILPKTDLQPFAITSPLKRIFLPGIASGILVGLTLFVLDKTLFSSSAFSGAHPPSWVGALASIYGGINEEVLLRLFLFSLIYFLLMKLFKSPARKRTYLLWSANILVAVLFGLGHLPAAFKITTPSGFEIFRILLLNGIAGLVFGWLYWSNGFFAAVLAHFVADLMLHVFLIW